MNSGRRKDELSENINKKTELKKRKVRLKNTVTEILEYLRGLLTSRLQDTKEWISNLENKVAKCT